MFSFTHQPPLVSLFSSTGSIPLSLFSTHTDLALPSDSFIHLLDDATSLPTLAAPTSIISPAPLHSESHPPEQSGKIGYLLGQTVLHIQSPTLTSTFIQCPPVTRSAGSGARERLTLKHPWMCMQVRNLGREWSFEVGMVDTAGREGVIRCSTFQKEPALKASSPPLLHLPLSFPKASAHLQTSWSTITLHLPTLLPHFTSAVLIRERDDAGEDLDGADGTSPTRGSAMAPKGAHSHVSYVKVYATCRLRRIWFSESMPDNAGRDSWELQFYGS